MCVTEVRGRVFFNVSANEGKRRGHQRALARLVPGVEQKMTVLDTSIRFSVGVVRSGCSFVVSVGWGGVVCNLVDKPYPAGMF